MSIAYSAIRSPLLKTTTTSATTMVLVLRAKTIAMARSSRRALRALHTVRRVGEPETSECRYFFYDRMDRKQSPWHHIPLFGAAAHPHEAVGSVFNFVNEIPRGTRAKMEIAGEEEFNPIKQDMKKGKPRYYHFDSLVNYGCLPQTWEDPHHVDDSTKYGGDNDPIDVVEIGRQVMNVGDVYPVKVLGVLGMIDDGETDWKVIAINVNDPLAAVLNDVRDLAKTELHDVVPSVHRWFRDYKIPDGKRPSEFAFNGEAQSREFAVEVIQQTHESWKQLIGNELATPSKLWTGNSSN